MTIIELESPISVLPASNNYYVGNLEPGDMTRYRIIFSVLNEEAAAKVSEGRTIFLCYFEFGTSSGKMIGHLPLVEEISFFEFLELLTITTQNYHTKMVAYLVYCYISGNSLNVREDDYDSFLYIIKEFDKSLNNWKKQIKDLLEIK